MSKFPFVIVDKNDGQVQLVLGEHGTTSYRVSRRLATHNPACDTPTIRMSGHLKVYDDAEALRLLIGEIQNEDRSASGVRRAELYNKMVWHLRESLTRCENQVTISGHTQKTPVVKQCAEHGIAPAQQCYPCQTRALLAKIKVAENGNSG